MAPLLHDREPPASKHGQEGSVGTFSKSTGNEESPMEKRFHRITVEPIIFSMMLCYGLLVPLKLQYLTERFTESFNITDQGLHLDDLNHYCSQDTNSTVDDDDDGDDIKHRIQQETILWSMYLSATTALPGIFTTTFLGAYSDRAGRKIALVLPCAGFTAYAAVYLAVTSFHLRIEYLFIAHFALGISGDFTLLLTGCFAYMADITTNKQRMFRIVILDLFGFIGAGVSQIAIGFWINAQGFLPPYLLILSTVFLCTLYSICVIEDSFNSQSHQQKLQQSSNMIKTLIKFFQSNSNNRRWRIIILLTILALRMTVFYSLSSITLLYGLGEPFCWDSIMVGFFSAGQYVVGAIGMLVGGKLLSKLFSEPTLMQLGFGSSILSIVLLALAPNNLVFFFVILVGIFRALDLPMIRSQMSKLVFPSEQGVMFACIGCMQSISGLISPLIFNTIFYMTVDSHATIVFYIMLGLLTIASLLTLILQIKKQDSSYMILRDPRENEHLTSSGESKKSYDSSDDGNVTTQRR